MNNKNILIVVAVGAAFLIGGYYLGNKSSTVTVETNNVSEMDATNTDVSVNTNTGSVSGVVAKPIGTKPAPTTSNSIRIGQKITLNDVSITPTKVSYDSRCPKDVKCIQAGSLDLSVLLEKGNLAQSLILTSGKSVVFGNRTITLTSVLPTRLSTKTILEADYRFVFTVTK